MQKDSSLKMKAARVKRPAGTKKLWGKNLKVQQGLCGTIENTPMISKSQAYKRRECKI